MRKILSVAVVTTTLATQPLIADERAVILIVGDGFDDTHVTMAGTISRDKRDNYY